MGIQHDLPELLHIHAELPHEPLEHHQTSGQHGVACLQEKAQHVVQAAEATRRHRLMSTAQLAPNGQLPLLPLGQFDEGRQSKVGEALLREVVGRRTPRQQAVQVDGEEAP